MVTVALIGGVMLGRGVPLARKLLSHLPRRWMVERTFSWLVQDRRASKDCARLAQTSEAFVCVARSRLMVRPLTLV